MLYILSVHHTSDSSCFGDSWDIRSGLVSCRKDSLDSHEALLPRPDLQLDCLPLFHLDLAKHVVLDHNHLVQLVNLSIDDFVLDGFDSPELDVLFVHIE